MSGFELRSYEFRRERTAGWQELEALLDRVAQVGLRGLRAEELHRLPVLYRSAASSLSVARAISLDRNLVAYLESLTARAYLHIYGAKIGARAMVRRFFVRLLPQLVREMGRSVVVSILLLLLGVGAGYSLVLDDLDRYEGLVDPGMADGRGPTSTREELLEVLKGEGIVDDGAWTGLLAAFAGCLFSHNARVGMLCFGLGFAAGIPVILLLFTNGVLLGAMGALHHHKGLAIEFWGWVLPHGVTELLAVALCGAAGLALGRALVAPGRHSRLQAVALAGRRAAPVVLGAVGLFLAAALIEGFFRQLVLGELSRYALTIGSTLFWLWYFLRCGRPASDGEGDG